MTTVLVERLLDVSNNLTSFAVGVYRLEAPSMMAMRIIGARSPI